MLFYRDGICVYSIPCIHRNVSTSLNNAVKGCVVGNKIPDNREGVRTPGLNYDCVAILILAHMKLAGSRMMPGAMCTSVDIHRAGAANAFATVMIECNRLLTLRDQLLVEHV